MAWWVVYFPPFSSVLCAFLSDCLEWEGGRENFALMLLHCLSKCHPLNKSWSRPICLSINFSQASHGELGYNFHSLGYWCMVKERQTVRILERTIGYNISVFVLHEAQSCELCESYDILLLVMLDQIHRDCINISAWLMSMLGSHFEKFPYSRENEEETRAILILEQLDPLDRSYEEMDMNF